MRNRDWSMVAVLVALVASGAGCGGPAKKPTPPPAPPPAPAVEQAQPIEPAEPALPAVPSTPVARPDGVIAVGQVGDVGATLAAFAEYARRVDPGVPAKVSLDDLVAAAAEDGIDLRGVDLTRPIRVAVLDPNRFPEPLIVVLGVKDEATLMAAARELESRVMVHGGMAAVGSYDALVAAGGYALTTLAAAPTRPMPSAEIDVAFVMKTYGPMLDAVLGQVVQQMPADQRQGAKPMLDMYLSVLRQVDRVELGVDVAGEHATATARVVPTASSTLAGFVGRQQPASFTLLARVPPGVVTMGGELDLDQVWEALGELAEPMMKMTYGDAAPAMAGFWKQWLQLDSGESGLSIDAGRGWFGMYGLWQIARPAAAIKAFSTYSAALSKMSMATMKTSSRIARHRGVKLWLHRFEPGKDATEEQRVMFREMGGSVSGAFGVSGKHLLFAVGGDALAGARTLIDLTRARPRPPAPGLAQAIAGAKQRGESYLVTFDLPALAQRFDGPVGDGADDADDGEEEGDAKAPAAGGDLEPTSFGLGVADGALVVRFTLPAGQLKAMAD